MMKILSILSRSANWRLCSELTTLDWYLKSSVAGLKLLILPAGGWLWVSSNTYLCVPSTWHAIHMPPYIDILLLSLQVWQDVQ
eukprot:7068619-Ditylum_brightwellii.AAC.1